MRAPRNVLVLALAVIGIFLLHIDVALPFCRPLCSLEVAIAEQCERDNCSDAHNQSRCSNRCYRESTRCRKFCRRMFSKITSTCREKCTQGDDTDLDIFRKCALKCFVKRSAALRFRFSPDCFLDTDDQVTCSACPVGHEGRQCERCAEGYLGNPTRPNKYCKLINVTCDCDVRGIVPNTLCDSSTQQCQCKTYAQGKRCSSCQDGYFHLSRDNQQGCLKCFCSGVSTQCSSSSYYREEITPMLNSDGTHNFVLTTRKLRSPISDGFTVNAEENEIIFDRFDGIQRARESLYIQLPPKFRGDKVSSYGGFLRFGISFTDSGTGRDYEDVDVEIISNHDKRIYHLLQPSPRSRNSNNYDIKLVESSFRNAVDGDYPSREDFMNVLSDIQAILIRATYNTEMGSFTLRDVSMDSAVPNKTSLRSAQEVESCTCPEGYAGLSCQDCAAGYLKVDSNEGPRCMRCNCNGHADSCDPDTGECLNCKDNTEGNRCQNCARGYYGDPTAGTPDDCRVCTCPLTILSNQFSPTCLLDRDNKVTCDRCPRGYTGRDCGICADGYRGDPRQPRGRCIPDDGPRPSVIVSPSSVTEPLGSTATFQCSPQERGPFNVAWSRLDGKPLPERATSGPGPNYILTITNLEYSDSARYVCTTTSVRGTTSQGYVVLQVNHEAKAPTVRIEPRYLQVNVGEIVEFRCIAEGTPQPTVQWTKGANNPLPSYVETDDNGLLRIDNVTEDDQTEYYCKAVNREGTSSVRTIIYVNRPTNEAKAPTVRIEPRYLQVDVGEIVEFRCIAEGTPQPTVQWTKGANNPLPSYVETDDNGLLRIDNVTEDDQTEYYCKAVNREGTSSVRTIIYVNRPTTATTVTPGIPVRIVNVGDKLEFECAVKDVGKMTMTWVKKEGPLPASVIIGGNHLIISNAQVGDSGTYKCTKVESQFKLLVQAPPVATVNPQQSVVTVGDTVVLECLIQGNVEADIRWEKVSGDLPPQHEIRNGLLTLYNVQVADTGRYMCTASNEGGLSRQIGYIQVNSATSVTPGIPVRIVNVGDRVEFECAVKDAGKTTMTWVKKEGPLPASVIIGGNHLIISNAQVGDSGTYRCTKVESQVKLVVQGVNTTRPIPPSQEHTTASLGSPAQLRCEASGSPQPRLSWIKEEGDLPDDHSIIDGGDLYIPRVREEDAGKYNCLASSSSGTHRYPVILIVESLVPYFQQNPASYMTFSPLTDAYLETDITMSFRPEATDGLILYNDQYGTGSGDYLCFGLREAYPEFRFDVGAGPAVIRGAKPLELNKWHTVQLRRNRKNGNLTINDEPVYRGEAPGPFQGLDLAQPLYLGSVPDFSSLPTTVSFNTGFVGGISQVELQGLNLNLGKDAREVVGVEAYPVCRNSNCENGGLCQPANNAKGFVCNCDRGYAGERCEIIGQKCFPGACGNQGRCVVFPNDQNLACICPIGLNGEGCNPGLTIVDPAFNKTSFISYPTIKDGMLSVRIQLIFKPRSLDDSVILYNARRTDGNEDFIALVIKDRHLEFRFDTGSGPVVLRSRYPLTKDAWTMVKADRIGRDGMLTIDQEEAVNGSTSRAATVGLNSGRPLFLGGIDPEEKLSSNAGASEGFVGCIGELTINDEKMDLIQDAIESVNVQDCGDRSLCARKPCKNNGNCVDVSPTEYRCECPQQFFGDDCEIDMNICVTSQPCLNEGNCLVTDTGALECQCPLGFMGRNCETAVELGTNVEFLKDGYVEYPRSFFPHRRRHVTEEILMTISTLEEGSALLFWQGQKAGETTKGDYLSISIVDGFVEFRYELGSGPAVIKSTTRVNDGFDHIIKAQRLGRKGALKVDSQPAIKGTSQGPLQVLNVQGNIFIGGVPDLSLHTDSLYTKNYEGCVSGIQLSGKPVIDFKSDPIGGMNVQPCLNSKK